MLSKDEVRSIAHLSRVHLQDDEIQKLTKDLEQILHYIDQLSQVDVSKVEPTSHVLPLKNVFREDIVKPSLAQSEALKISVSQHNGSFKVPQVIE
ncbi:MAG: Asp-tRNA(Asn)/Glu-tRNA(Gln) amidotransferase subunit GatC [Candidatus Omnitrophota bacterium]